MGSNRTEELPGESSDRNDTFEIKDDFNQFPNSKNIEIETPNLTEERDINEHNNGILPGKDLDFNIKYDLNEDEKTEDAATDAGSSNKEI